jgi:hypothetical protein
VLLAAILDGRPNRHVETIEEWQSDANGILDGGDEPESQLSAQRAPVPFDVDARVRAS